MVHAREYLPTDIVRAVPNAIVIKNLNKCLVTHYYVQGTFCTIIIKTKVYINIYTYA